MLDRYDLAFKFAELNQDLSFCIRDEMGSSILLQYCAWCEIMGVEDFKFNEKREEFFCQLIPDEGDALTRILSEENEGNRKAQIEFLFSYIDFIEEFKRINMEENFDIGKKEKQMKNIKNPSILTQLIGVSLNPGVNLYTHVSLVNKKGIQMFYYKDLGVFFSVGIDVDIDSYTNYKDMDFLKIFKALGDESRLNMVKALNKENLTAGQLAEKVKLTLPTVNHHLKQLAACGLISLVLESKEGKGALHCLNREVIKEIMEVIKIEIS